MDKLYFLGRNNKVYTSDDIVKSAFIGHGISIETNEEIRNYARCCNGIERELSNASVEDLIRLGASTQAVILYREDHGCSLVEAHEYVENFRKEIEMLLEEKQL